MAFYKYERYLAQNQNAAFDSASGPGQPTPYSGIYKCRGCGREIAANAGNPLPPQNHHQHSYQQGQISWLLIVASEHE